MMVLCCQKLQLRHTEAELSTKHAYVNYAWNADKADQKHYMGMEKALVGSNLLSYYLANKRSLHVRSQGLKILTLIGEK